jgi:hypothetical protein
LPLRVARRARIDLTDHTRIRAVRTIPSGNERVLVAEELHQEIGVQADDRRRSMTQNQADTPAQAPRAVPSKNKVDVATELRQRITHMLVTRRAQHGTFAANAEDKLKRGGARAWLLVKRRPSLGVVLVSGSALAVASTIGVGEIMFTLIVGYAAYQVLREGVSPKNAAEEAVKLMEAVE